MCLDAGRRGTIWRLPAEGNMQCNTCVLFKLHAASPGADLTGETQQFSGQETQDHLSFSSSHRAAYVQPDSPPVKEPADAHVLAPLKSYMSTFQFEAVAPLPSCAVTVMVKSPLTAAGAPK